jgi:D-proline reductase (dithiol) PrdB
MSNANDTPGSETGETLEQFRRSFSYGSRSNLNFKFMKSMSDDEAAAFIEDTLRNLSDAYNTGDVAPMIETAISAQIAGYAPDPNGPPPTYRFDSGPFSPASVPVSDARIGLLTTSGHYPADEDPAPDGLKGMSQDDAEDRISESLKETPVLSEIPVDSTVESVTVRHGGYDIRAAQMDRNVAFPIDRLNEMNRAGVLGSLAATFFSFPGATSQGRLKRELDGWVERIAAQNVDYMLLVPV